MAKNLDLSAEQLLQLENLGIYINYNGYGSDIADLHFAPADLYRLAAEYANPLDFIEDGSEYFQRLETGYHQDLSSARAVQALAADSAIAVYELPDAPWARRVSGVYSNDLTNQNPDRAHAVLTAKSNGHYLVSVRAPLNNKQGASALCRQFPTGGGREAAAGINDLPADMLESFINALRQALPMSSSPTDRPFSVLGVQQIAIGAADKQQLRSFWVDLLGLPVRDTFVSESENVDEDICEMGAGDFVVEVDLMQPLDRDKKPRVDTPALNHVGLWIDNLEAAVDWLTAQGLRFTPGGIRKGAASYDVCFVHPKGNDEFPLSSQGVLVELVQAPDSVINAYKVLAEA